VRSLAPAPIVALLALAFGACATTPAAPPPPVTQTPPAPAVAAVPPGPSPREILTGRHRERAEALERQGALRQALDEWDVALTIAPDDAASRAGRARLAAQIEDAVAKRIQEGRAALGRGAVQEARRLFLGALALAPANRVAFEALQNEARELPFIPHVVRAGDTLAALAQRYYGDRTRSEVIWETNRLAPNARLAAGTTLKIPEIPGVPFVRADTRREPAPPAGRPDPTPPPARVAEPPREEVVEVNPLLADARDALERSEYATALADVDKFLAGNAGNREGLEIKKVALYRQAKQQLDQRKFGDSYRSFVQLTRLQPDYQDAGKLLREAKSRAVERHYSEGIRLYREERLPEAIAEWRAVLEVEPHHPNALRNIEQAERLLKGLEQRRKR
jgi:tetratricopeptide (TPR) repeat protein